MCAHCSAQRPWGNHFVYGAKLPRALLEGEDLVEAAVPRGARSSPEVFLHPWVQTNLLVAEKESWSS